MNPTISFHLPNDTREVLHATLPQAGHHCCGLKSDLVQFGVFPNDVLYVNSMAVEIR